MNDLGPPLEAILRRIAETPADFLGEPALAQRDGVAVAALLGDVIHDLGLGVDGTIRRAFAAGQPGDQRNRLMLGSIAAWLLADDWLRDRPPAPSRLSDFLLTSLGELAGQASAHAYVEQADRREELARTMLARLGLRPAGESAEQARDRLSAVSALERARLLDASRLAEQRAREVRDALARKAAHESADKWTRE
ncbi:hypothetical protein SH584_04930 [Sphingomonas sp. LY29]|uniref:hypothetical protein n=1 Tax=Sphingomonas sp. LY29 TaxID=3095341 RepID=UPI002D76AA15|nr:hypothetical protein [Sphingomonas sp. LY29]WRP26771.1 hypothetical protein SH584_04930 [Sphingomonas sp. LY29]